MNTRQCLEGNGVKAHLQDTSERWMVVSQRVRGALDSQLHRRHQDQQDNQGVKRHMELTESNQRSIRVNNSRTCAAGKRVDRDKEKRDTANRCQQGKQKAIGPKVVILPKGNVQA